MWNIGRKVVSKDAEENWADQGALGDAIGHREGKGAPSYHLPTVAKVAFEPRDINTVPFQFRE